MKRKTWLHVRHNVIWIINVFAFYFQSFRSETSTKLVFIKKKQNEMLGTDKPTFNMNRFAYTVPLSLLNDGRWIITVFFTTFGFDCIISVIRSNIILRNNQKFDQKKDYYTFGVSSWYRLSVKWPANNNLVIIRIGRVKGWCCGKKMKGAAGSVI